MLLNCGVGKDPWTARSNQSILKEISPEYSLEGLILKLKFQYFGHLMWRADSFEKTLMLGGIGGRRRRGQQRTRWLDGITNSWTWVCINYRSCWWTRRSGMLRLWGRKESDTTKRLNWTELKAMPLLGSKVQRKLMFLPKKCINNQMLVVIYS